MKKSLSLILVLTLCIGCVFAMAACGKEEQKSIYDLAAELAPTKTVTFVDYKAANGDELGGEYILECDGDDSIFTYTYDRYRTAEEAIADGVAEPIKTFTGAVYCKDGKYSGDGVNWGSSPVATEIKLNLVADKLTGAVISEDGKTLTATLTAENAVAVLGTDLAAEGELAITVTSNGTYLTGITVLCTTKLGAKVRISTSYSYNKLMLVFPES